MTVPQLPPYGPNTPVIRRFLVRLAALGKEQRAAVVENYRAVAETPVWLRAETVLGETIEASGRGDIPATLAGPLLQLVRSPENGVSKSEGPFDDELLEPIAEPALAALLALAVSDLLPPNVLATLYAPVAGAVPRE